MSVSFTTQGNARDERINVRLSFSFLALPYCISHRRPIRKNDFNRQIEIFKRKTGVKLIQGNLLLLHSKYGTPLLRDECRQKCIDLPVFPDCPKKSFAADYVLRTPCKPVSFQKFVQTDHFFILSFVQWRQGIGMVIDSTYFSVFGNAERI
jgi:hypothetical protein